MNLKKIFTAFAVTLVDAMMVGGVASAHDRGPAPFEMGEETPYGVVVKVTDTKSYMWNDRNGDGVIQYGDVGVNSECIVAIGGPEVKEDGDSHNYHTTGYRVLMNKTFGCDPEPPLEIVPYPRPNTDVVTYRDNAMRAGCTVVVEGGNCANWAVPPTTERLVNGELVGFKTY